MTKTQYRKAIAALGLSQVGVARLFDIDPRTSRRYALGESKVPVKIAKLLELMMEREKKEGA